MKPQMIFAIHGIVDAKLQIKPQKSSPLDNEISNFGLGLDDK
jgi:hypothetical protein